MLPNGEIKILDLGRAIIHPTINTDFVRKHFKDSTELYNYIAYLSLMKKSLKMAKDSKEISSLVEQELKNIENFKKRAIERAKKLAERAKLENSELETHLEEINKAVDDWKTNLNSLIVFKTGKEAISLVNS